MNKYFTFRDSIDDDSIDSFIEFLNECNEHDRIDIMFTSGGGSFARARDFARIINKDDRIQNVIFSWGIQSAAVDFCFLTKPSKRIIDKTAWCMLHLSTRKFDYRDEIKKDECQEFLRNDMMIENCETIELLRKIKVSEDNINKCVKGEDIYFHNCDFMKLIENYDKEVAIYA